MRCRNIKPAFFKNERLAELPMAARLLFQGLWCLAARDGRLEDRAKRIKAEIFPYEDIDVDEMLDALAFSEEQFIIRYEVDGRKYIQITNFEKHNHCHRDEKDSGFPPPPEKTPEEHGASTVQARCKHGASTVRAPEEHQSGPASYCLLHTDNCLPLKERESCGLSALLSLWNTLKGENLVLSGVNPEKPSDAVAKAWRKSRRDQEQRERLENIDDIAAAIRASPFAHRMGWFSLPALIGGKNKNGEWICQKLLEGAYKNEHGRESRDADRRRRAGPDASEYERI